MKAFARTLAAGLIVLNIVGCGGGGDSTPAQPTAQKGFFIDSAVGGLGYVCGAFSGVTGADGSFDYEAGSTCTFAIGGIKLGTALASALITPVGLVSGAIDETNPAVVNITRLLLSLDTDNNPSNGIAIASSVATVLAKASLDFSQAATFDAQALALVGSAISGRTLASASAARAELGASLLGLLAGSYNCTYTAVQPGGGGTAKLTISGGAISGTALGSAAGSTSSALSGTISTAGSTTLATGVSSGGATFTGTFKSDGTGRGTWLGTGGAATDSGTWSCQKA